jgi:hypothetical protein
MNGWPGEPPGSSQTVLVCGIETFLDVMEPAEAQNFLKTRVKPFVQEFQAHWDQRGLVFGFGTHERSFEVSFVDEEVFFIRRGGARVRLSYSLWDGSATMNVARLIRNEQGTSITVGYHVQWIS